MFTRILGIGLSLVMAAPALANDHATIDNAVEAARTWRESHEKEILTDYMTLLAIPNYAAKVDDIYRNADFIMAQMEARGIKTELLELEGKAPAIYGELLSDGAEKTIVVYVHYDGQPVEASEWQSNPYQPIIRSGKLEEGATILDPSVLNGAIDPNWRVYARSASDDKAPIIGILAALDALEEAGIVPSVNLKFFFEGEEEIGSPNLNEMVSKYADKLAGDYWLFFDGPQDQRGNARVVLGVRGVMGGQITVYGPSGGLHSGHYGNFAPNPIGRLALLLASMRNDDGLATIDGFYDQVNSPTDVELEFINQIPQSDVEIMRSIGVADREFEDMRYEKTHMWPALNFQGIRAGGVGNEARNVVVPSATVNIGVRMVPAMTKERTAEVIDAHIEKQGYHIVREEPDMETRLKYPKLARVNWSSAGYGGVRTSPEEPNTARLIEIMQYVTDDTTLVYPTLGGSLPLAIITENLDVPLVVLPIANQDNSQHAANENIRIGHLWKGIEIYAAIFAAMGD